MEQNPRARDTITITGLLPDSLPALLPRHVYNKTVSDVVAYFVTSVIIRLRLAFVPKINSYRTLKL